MESIEIDEREPFPLNYDEWKVLWRQWLADRKAEGTFRPSSWRFPQEKNLLADEVLGVWSINDRNVELSAVTFTLGPDHDRYIGVTFGTGAGTDSGGIAETFSELRAILGI